LGFDPFFRRRLILTLGITDGGVALPGATVKVIDQGSMLELCSVETDVNGDYTAIVLTNTPKTLLVVHPDTGVIKGSSDVIPVPVPVLVP
jgi:hypothetical protein